MGKTRKKESGRLSVINCVSGGHGSVDSDTLKACKLPPPFVRFEWERSCGRWPLLLFFVVAGFLLTPGRGQSAVTEYERLPQPVDQWRISTTIDYSSGRYGTEERTNILYVPLTIKRLFKQGDISLAIPYVSISGTGAVRLVGGVGTRTSSVAGSEGNVSGSDGRKRPGDSPLSSSTTDSGLGDIILRGRYYLVEEGSLAPLVALVGRIKFPTADADRGLGTGEFDGGGGVELTKSLGERWMGYLDAGYYLIGNPPGANFNNQWWYDVGVGYDLTDHLQMSLFYEEYRALVDEVNNARNVLLAADYRAGSGWHMTGALLVGLSNGAPNYGISGGIRFQF